MARKEDNLILGGKAHPLTVEDQSKGGKKSVEVRRERANIAKAMQALLEKNYKGKDGVVLSGAEAIALKQMEKALKGDAKAFELVRDSSGQKPVEKVVTAEVSADVISEVEKAVFDE